MMPDVKHPFLTVPDTDARTVLEYRSLLPAILLEVHPGNKRLLTLETLSLRFGIQHSGEQ